MLDYILQSPFWISIFTLISEDGAYIYGLTLYQLQKISAAVFIFYFCLGVFVGDTAVYSLGYALARFRHTFWVASICRTFTFLRKMATKKDILPDAPVHKKVFLGRFEQFLLFTRCLPGSRFITYFYCGFTAYPLWKFIILLTFSSLIFACLGVVISMLIGGITGTMHWSFFIMIAFITFMITFSSLRFLFFYLYHYQKFGKVWIFFRIKIIRLRRLEFWPALWLYAGLVPFFIFCLIRYRGFSCALAANPALYMSGFAGEKKSDIDVLLRRFLPEHCLITQSIPIDFVAIQDQEVLHTTLQQYLLEQGMKLPVFIKPEIGLKGFQVRLCTSMQELMAAIQRMAHSDQPMMMQEACLDPCEWGVFYYRFPGKKQGQIFSVTHKIFPEVTGDGMANLEKLVMDNPEYRLRYESLLGKTCQDHRLVLAEGQRKQLVFCGNHAQGCLFRDGSSFLSSAITTRLTHKFDQLQDFYIGRMDIRFASIEALAAGQFKIIELNGAGAESTNIYDPNMSLWQVYKTLHRQWQLIFSIGQKNKDNGLVPPGIWSFFRELWKLQKIKNSASLEI